ncbi:unnamed protein product [Heligmosomoides polygyrus]|uniref:Uncharacterized protein n=1 Tax=Heligmosomoides polygyrus TaxID=6339 RepID=A0A3P8DZM2_HELPZ|nr:unnamed protein product [Heligmosomoides polygyrus]
MSLFWYLLHISQSMIYNSPVSPVVSIITELLELAPANNGRKERHIGCSGQMISLAHHSYVAMVNEADRTEDALKLATWWNKFLEGVERGRPNAEVLEILEMRATALESLIELDDNNRNVLIQKLLDTLIRSYKVTLTLISMVDQHHLRPRAYFPLPRWSRSDEFCRATRKNSNFSMLVASPIALQGSKAIRPGPTLNTARGAKMYAMLARGAGSHHARRPPLLRRPRRSFL